MSKSARLQAAPMPEKINAQSLHQQLITTASSLPPGRPGNLTPEEDAKLKEFWGKLLEVFGVKPKTDSVAATPVSPVAEKKSSGGFFGRKKEAAPEDKHGTNKGYNDALANMTPEELQTAFFKMAKQDAPDAAVLRYLRARKWNVQPALEMLISALYWREREFRIDDDLMFNGEAGALRDATAQHADAAAKKEGEDFISQFRMGKSFQYGFDKEGRPCNYVRVRLHRGGEQTVSSIERFTIFLIETTRFMINPPVDTGTIVFDMTGFSLANMDYTPVKFMIKCFEANYPESLGAVLIYKAPWIFQGIWKVIKGWLDPVVAAKVHFANNVNELAEYIDRDKIMKELDGDGDYTYTYVEPVPGENDKMKDTATRDQILAERQALIKEFDQNTLAWIGGQDVYPQRTKITFDLHRNYYKLDPYIRARSLYDRLGYIDSDNQLGWDAAKVEAALK